MARIAGAACIVLAAGALAAGILAGGHDLPGRWIWVAAAALLAALWLAGYWRGLGWIAHLGLGFVAVAAAAGLWVGLAAGWMVFGLVAGLCAWDLHRFTLCLGSVEQVDQAGALERSHLQRLLVVAGLGLLLAVLALRIEIELTFLTVVLLGLLAAWGLSRAVAFLRRESD